MKRLVATLPALLGLVLLFNACVSRRAPTLRPNKYHGMIRVACVGDSITYGSGVEGRETNSYPAVLERLLGMKFQTRNYGVGGATLLKKGDKPYWKEPQFAAISEFEPQVVIIKLGTNDSKPQNWQYQNEFAADLRAMVDHFAKLKSKPTVWICLPAPVYETRWGINEKVVAEEVIPGILQVAQEKKLPIIDLHTALANRPELFPDKIHPNATGAALMAKVIRDALLGE